MGKLNPSLKDLLKEKRKSLEKAETVEAYNYYTGQVQLLHDLIE
jgi:hypothetical protein